MVWENSGPTKARAGGPAAQHTARARVEKESKCCLREPAKYLRAADQQPSLATRNLREGGEIIKHQLCDIIEKDALSKGDYIRRNAKGSLPRRGKKKDGDYEEGKEKKRTRSDDAIQPESQGPVREGRRISHTAKNEPELHSWREGKKRGGRHRIA